MWQDNLTQGFWHNSRPKIGVCYCFERLGTFSVVSLAMIAAMSDARNTFAIAIPLKEQSPNTSTSLSQTPTPPLTLPPAVFPTNQAPAVSVPSLQQFPPAETPLPVTPAQAPERPPESASPTPNSAPVIEFGKPLPETTASTPQSAIPTLEPAVNVVSQEPAVTNVNPEILLPSGTQLSLLYPGEKVLNLQAYQLRQEVLLLQEDLRDRNHQVIAPAGTPVIGYFETSSTSSRFIAKAIVLRGSNLPFEAQSDNLEVTPPEETTSDQSLRQPGTTIQPGQILQVQLQSDWRFSAISN